MIPRFFTQKKQEKEMMSQKQKQGIASAIFVVFTLGFLILYIFLPNLTQKEKSRLTRIPTNLNEVQALQKVLHLIAEKHTFYVYFLLSYAYIVLCSFGLPGVGPIAMLSANLFGGFYAFLMCTLCSTLGGSFCFWLSYTLAGRLVEKLFPSKIAAFHNSLNKNRKNIFWYMLCVRITPIIPKWFVNLASPIVGIPFKAYFFATLIGYVPANLIFIKMGLTLNNLQTLGINLQSFITLVIIGLLTLIPIKLRKTLEKRIE